MSDKVYVKIEGIKGPVKVSGFTDYFEAHYADGGSIVNQFTASNNGQSYAGVPIVSNLRMRLKNCTADVSSTLHQYTLKAQSLTEVTVSQISRVQGADTETHGLKYQKAHIIAYHYEASTGDLDLEIGNFANIETAHYNIADDGKVTPMRVKYDLTQEAVS